MSTKNTEQSTDIFSNFNLLTGDAIVEPSFEIKDSAPAEEVEEKEEVKEEVKSEKKETPSKKEATIDYKIEHVDNIEDVYEDEKEDETPLKAEKTDIKKVDAAPEGSDTDIDDDSTFRVLAEHFHDKGIVDYDSEEFEDSEEGFEKLIENAVTKGVDKYKNSLTDLSKNFVNYVENGGDPYAFLNQYSSIDYDRIDMEKLESNEGAQKQIVSDLLAKEGYVNEEIDEELTDYEDAGILYNKAKRALKKLQSYQAKANQELIENQKKAQEAEIAKHGEFLEALKEDITNRSEIAGFNLSERQRTDFYDYITKRDRRTGRTGLETDAEKDKDAQLKMAWLYYNKFDFSKMEKKVKKKVTSDLKARLSRSSIGATGMKSTRRSKSPEDVSNDFSLFRKSI